MNTGGNTLHKSIPQERWHSSNPKNAFSCPTPTTKWPIRNRTGESLHQSGYCAGYSAQPFHIKMYLQFVLLSLLMLSVFGGMSCDLDWFWGRFLKPLECSVLVPVTIQIKSTDLFRFPLAGA